MDRVRTRRPEYPSAKHLTLGLPVGALLQAGPRKRRESFLDAEARRAVYGISVLWGGTDDGLFAARRMGHQSQTNPTTLTDSGALRTLPQAPLVPRRQRAQEVPLSSQKYRGPSSQPSVGQRYYVRTNAARVSVCSRRDGLVQSLRLKLGTFQYLGSRLLSVRLRSSVGKWNARNLQYRPGGPIDQYKVDRTTHARRNPDQHGWAGSLLRQYLRRTSLEKCEIRRSISSFVRFTVRGPTRIRSVLLALQPNPTSPGAPVPNALRGLYKEE